MSPRALVTGGTGFLGGVLARRLAREGWEVHAIIRPQSDPGAMAGLTDMCELHEHDGSTARLLRILADVRPEVVFHLASLFLSEHTPEHVEDLVRSNLLFPTQLVEAMTQASCLRLVNSGTSWQHYHTDAYRPVNLYAATKQAFEDILRYYHDARRLSYVTLKLFDTYGPGDHRHKVLNALIDAASSGRPIDMVPGDQLMDLTHAEDVARAFVQAADILTASATPLSDSCFVTGERLTIGDLVDLVAVALGKKVDARMGARAYAPRTVMLPTDPSTNTLPGWERQFSLAGYLRSLAEEPPGDRPRS